MTLQLEAAPKICNVCGAANAFDAKRCESCGRDRFAPPWVRALRGIDNTFSVQVKEPHEDSEGTTPVLSFYRSRRGGYSTFNIYEQSHWERVKEIVDSEFLERLGWRSGEELVAALNADAKGKNGKAKGNADGNGNGAAGKGNGSNGAATPPAKDPRLLLTVAESLAAAPLDELDLDALSDARERVAKLAAKVEEAQRTATRSAIESVSKDKRNGVQQLAELIEGQTRGDRVAAEVELRRRVGVLELLKERFADDRSYKIVNYRSAIHRLIERAIWVFDERYWLADAAKELRTALDRAVVAGDRPYAKKPADFACAVEDDKLLVVSAKPPKGDLAVADLDKLEQQVASCRAHGSFESFEAILVGKEVSDELRETIEMRDSAFQVRTYDEVVEKSLRSYSTRLEALAAS
jgi:hypothetical protein